MKKLKKIFIIALTSIVATTSLPCIESNASNSIVMETVDSTPVRSECSKKSNTICTLNPGTIVTVTDAITNEHDNLWYITDSNEYIFDIHLIPHTCNYNISYESDFTACKCGKINSTSEGVTNVALTEATLGTAVMVPGVREAVIASGILVGTYYLGKTLVPYIVNTLGRIELISTTEYEEVTRRNNDNPDSEIKYYPAILLKPDDELFTTENQLLILYSRGMDTNEALDFLIRFAEDRLLNTDVTCNIYAFEQEDARLLAEKAAYSTHVFAAYGSSNLLEGNEIDKDRATGGGKTGYYHHYHLYSFDYNKANTHIFYGFPGQYYIPDNL